jgi:protein-S-isoprenylcysteine O-methyltransferase Ste14
MTYGHLLFAVATTGYIMVGVFLEERDLVAHFGDRYRAYRARVWGLVPLPPRKAG